MNSAWALGFGAVGPGPQVVASAAGAGVGIVAEWAAAAAVEWAMGSIA